jgi:hypothetical protein
MFKTWQYGGIRYLALRTRDGNFMVFDEEGNSYGAWQDVETMRKWAVEGRAQPIGKVCCILPVVYV